MLDWIRDYLSSDSFIAMGYSFQRRPDFLWINVCSNALIALSYFSIPASLIYFVRKREDLEFNWIFVLFAAFIVACGLTYTFDIMTIWWPYYGISSAVKIVCAFISFLTAIALWFLIPLALSVPSTRQFEAVNKARNRLEQRMLEIKEREEMLAAREEHLRIVTDSLPSLVSYLSHEHRYVSHNKAYERWFGPTCRDLIGKTMAEVLGEETYALITPHLELAFKGERVTFEMLAPYSKGGNRFIHVNMIPDLSATGEIRGVISVVSDFTERKRSEIEILRARQAAEQANQAKSAFLANMSHEIRTPLGAVLGFSELLVNTQVSTEEKLKYADAVRRNGDLLSNIVNDILDLSKIEAGKLDIEKTEVPISEVIKDLNSLLSLRAQEKGLRLTITSSGSVPKMIHTDPLRLRQILLNIVGNAIKFTHKGSVDIIIKMIESHSSKQLLAFVVKDTGSGISAEHVQKLFEPFVQADHSTTRKFGGTGLGLALSKRLANQLGGDLYLEISRIGEGSTFVLTTDPGMQKISMRENLNLRDIAIAPADHAEMSLTANLKGIDILLVDDAHDNQMLISLFLKVAGANVTVANNGRQALEHVARKDFDVILMDLQMPEMDGFEATRRLRESGYLKPVVALTAHALKEEKKKCLDKGFTDHLSKPVNRRELIETIYLLAKRSQRFSPVDNSPML